MSHSNPPTPALKPTILPSKGRRASYTNFDGTSREAEDIQWERDNISKATVSIPTRDTQYILLCLFSFVFVLYLFVFAVNSFGGP